MFFTALLWLKDSWLGKAAALIAAVAGVFLFGRYKGGSAQRAKQKEANQKEYIDVGKRADEAARKADAADGSRDAVLERLRKHSAVRDDSGV